MKRKRKTFDDLLRIKLDLKYEISGLESEIKDNKFLKISSSFLGEESLKDSIFDSISSVSIKELLKGPLAKLLSTFLMSNKITRKYFVPFTIIKEMIPFVIEKINSFTDENNLNERDKKD